MTVYRRDVDPALLARLRAAPSFFPPREEAEPEPVVEQVRDRPVTMKDIVGQERLLTQLQMVCAGSNLRNTPMPHILLSGPAGHGKTTLSKVIAAELEATLVTTTGMVLRKPADLLGLLVKMTGPTVLFIDEIHALPVSVMEMLYEVLEDGTVSTVVGSGADGRAQTHQLTDFVCVGATTRPGVLTRPFLQRFGFQGVVEQYTPEELAEIVQRAWRRVGAAYEDGAALEVATRCKGVPRRSLHLAERVLDYSSVHGDLVSEKMAQQALSFFGIDTNGLEADDHRILEALTGPFAGRTVGLDALSQQLGMDSKTLADQYEPWLMQQGYISRTKTGRMALPAAYELLS